MNFCLNLQQKQDDKKVNKKEEKDSRNLYLSREGLIREGTKAAIGVSKSDLKLRVNLEKRKKEMLKDLNRFISKDRLCFRNLPLDITDAKLKALILKFVEPKPKIEALKVMKDMKTGKNKGFAFVSLVNHEMALQVLRSLNNNPEVFHKDQRPIIEFSIENRKALNARQKRLEKSREKNPTFQSNDNKTSSATTKEKGKKSQKVLGPYNPQKNEPVTDEELSEKKPEFMGSTNKPGQKSLPSHIGPKIRHNRSISRKDIKKKEKLMKNPRKRKALNESLSHNNAEHVSKDDNAVPSSSSEPKAKKAKKNKPSNKKKISKAQVKDMLEEKQFTKMVQQYKQKLLVPKSAKKTKWFE